MNNKITFPKLASMLADKSGRTKRFSEDFLREFFSLISETLENGETVKVKGLGTFRLSRVEPRKSVDVTTGEPMEISGHTKVVFVPSKEMADAVNAPFEAFSAIEISEGIDESALEDETSFTEEITEDRLGDTEETADLNEAPEGIAESEPIIVPDSSDETINIEDEDTITPEESENIITEQEITPDDDTDEEIEDFEIEENRNNRHWLKGFLAGICAAIAMVAIATGCWIYFARPDIIGRNTTAQVVAIQPDRSIADTIIEATAEDSVSIAEPLSEGISGSSTVEVKSTSDEVPTAPSDEIIYDTIGKTRYLTTMAKAHYGNYNLWPYIYEENKKFLRHPDRIRPGTPVVVPKLSKYGVNPKNPKDIEAAKKLGVEIYARYKKD